VSRERALLLVWPFQAELHTADSFAHGDFIDPWDAEALARFQGDTILHVGHLEPKADRVVNTSRKFVRLLRERFDLQLRLTATVGACAFCTNGLDDPEALTVWKRKRKQVDPQIDGVASTNSSSERRWAACEMGRQRLTFPSDARTPLISERAAGDAPGLTPAQVARGVGGLDVDNRSWSWAAYAGAGVLAALFAVIAGIALRLLAEDPAPRPID
jgi:hypothetical protein